MLIIWQKWEQLDDEGIFDQETLDDFVGELRDGLDTDHLL
jgi:hypothetical protein